MQQTDLPYGKNRSGPGGFVNNNLLDAQQAIIYEIFRI